MAYLDRRCHLVSLSTIVVVSVILSSSLSSTCSSILELLVVYLKGVGLCDLLVVLKWSEGE